MNELQAGRELDVRVAIEVMGWQVVYPYSTDVAAAWQVIEHLRDQGADVEIGVPAHTYRWYCEVRPREGTTVHWHAADTMPLAVCRAALKVLGVPGE